MIGNKSFVSHPSSILREASAEHLLNWRGVYGAILAKRSESKKRDIAESS
jgi:hypothetical protein